MRHATARCTFTENFSELVSVTLGVTMDMSILLDDLYSSCDHIHNVVFNLRWFLVIGAVLAQSFAPRHSNIFD